MGRGVKVHGVAPRPASPRYKGHEEREMSSVLQDLPPSALKVRGAAPLGGWEMRWRIQIVQIERDADDTCNFLEIPNLLGPLFLAGMQVVLSGIFTSMVLLNREEGQE